MLQLIVVGIQGGNIGLKIRISEYEANYILNKQAYLEALTHADTSDNFFDLTTLLEWCYK